MGTPTADWPAKFTFDEFWNFTEPLEGGFAADCMLLVQDLQVATGMGITFTGKNNRNAGLAMAKALEWVYKPGHPRAGDPCDPSDIARDFDVVLSHEELGRPGPQPGSLKKWKDMTNCRITKDGLRKGVKTKAVGNIKYVKTLRTGNKYLGDFDTFPADAQLCVISLTWANGNEFNYPTFAKACREANWFEAAKQCGFESKANTLPKRQKDQETMMCNAGCVKLGVAPDTLHWPKLLALPDVDWLEGWWTVWDGSYYFYYFEPNGWVSYIETKPNPSAPAPINPHNRGTYFFETPGRMIIDWKEVGGASTRETFYDASSGAKTMHATSTRFSPLYAEKM
jgi:hypothetical protein